MPRLRYPPSAQGPDTDVYHGETVADPYRWLETTTSPETTAWIGAQNELTSGFLDGCADRAAIREQLTRLSDYPRLGPPLQRGGRWFQFRQLGLQDQPVLYTMDAPDAPGRVLLDPNALAADGTVAVTSAEPSEDGRLLAYSTSAAGSDWQTYRIREVATGSDLPDLVEWARFCTAAWRKDGSGFYYLTTERPPPGTEYLAEIGARRLMFHPVGARPDGDEVVYEAEEPNWYPVAQVSDDDRFLIISVFVGTAPQARVLVADLTRPGEVLRPLIDDFDSVANVITTRDSAFYLVTDYQAEQKRVAAVQLERPQRSEWREVIAEQPDTLLAANFFGGRFVCHYLRDAHSALRVHAADGTFVREIPLPGYASAADACKTSEGLAGHPDSELMHFGLASFADSGSLWSHRLDTGETNLVSPSTAAIDPAAFIVEQVRVTSPDGTGVPMFLARRKDVEPDGDARVLLYGYGGFDVPVTPWFSVLLAGWLEGGGVLAVANLRGGGEYGRAWHHGGRLANKQNVFDDFCACARWLVSSGWSRPERIAITGASNGGLLVGACLTQHPELFGACVAFVGVLDMLRFQKFTVGRAWVADYGDPDNPEQYRWLRAYSPLHNLRPGERYPATLLLTGDHDDRVVPGHSFKFAAALQAAQGGDAPVLIRVETSAGHGAGKPVSKIIGESADVLAFLRLALARDHGEPRS